MIDQDKNIRRNAANVTIIIIKIIATICCL